MKPQELVGLISSIQDIEPQEIDDSEVKNILESLDELSEKEAAEFGTLITPEKSISKDELGSLTSLPAVLVRFLRHHVDVVKRIELFKKLMTKHSSMQSIAAEMQRILGEHELFQIRTYARLAKFNDSSADKIVSDEKKRLYKIAELWKETLNALLSDTLEPYQALLVCEIGWDERIEKYVSQDFISAIPQISGDKLDNLVAFWVKIMPEVSKRMIRKVYLDSEKQSKAKENAKRALILLGEYNLLSSIENVEGDVFMGDTYNNSGQAGAFGANSKAHDFVMNQHNIENIDFEKLAQELSTLHKAMKEKAKTDNDEHDIAIGNVAMAKQAAQEKNGKTVSEKLKAAGKWALEVATTIGTTIAAEAIKVSLGLK